MDLSDILTGSDIPRPVHPDMDRVMDIVLEMKAITAALQDDPAAAEASWRKHVESVIDYDVLAYQAIQVASQVFGIRTGWDLQKLRSDHKRNELFITAIQVFYDGFLLGAEFQQRGGHRHD